MPSEPWYPALAMIAPHPAKTEREGGERLRHRLDAVGSEAARADATSDSMANGLRGGDAVGHRITFVLKRRPSTRVEADPRCEAVVFCE